VHDELTNGGSLKGNSKVFPVLYFLIKYIAPLAIAAIFITGLLA
jgi:NSS family neurotransmitter:Na+ symporter